MTALVVVGAQWGDEGKGKIVDYLASLADVVVRYAGGPNAGHTLVVGGNKIVVRLVPSGILWANKTCVLAQGMVIDPVQLVKELDELSGRGYSIDGRLFVSDRAHLILPHHILADTVRENSAAAGRAIGTTKRGIGPAYEDKMARRGLLAGMLRDLPRARGEVEVALAAWRPFFAAHNTEAPSVAEVMQQLEAVAPRIVPLLADTSALTYASMKRGARVLLEGAQGTLLDIDHGTYPFVTSSSAVAGGACTGVGIGPRAISRALGITKAYATRVGEGPFPTELHDSTGERIRQAGAEFGSVTGRPRRAGWLDVPALRYAVRVNGFDALVMTKLDVLTGIEPLRVCVAYDTPEGRVDDFPMSYLGRNAQVTPVFENLQGWTESLDGVRAMTELPIAAQNYVKFVEQAVGVDCDIVSVGPDRAQTIVLRNPFDR